MNYIVDKPFIQLNLIIKFEGGQLHMYQHIYYLSADELKNTIYQVGYLIFNQTRFKLASSAVTF